MTSTNITFRNTYLSAASDSELGLGVVVYEWR